jgi:hypothetical protein
LLLLHFLLFFLAPLFVFVVLLLVLVFVVLLLFVLFPLLVPLLPLPLLLVIGGFLGPRLHRSQDAGHGFGWLAVVAADVVLPTWAALLLRGLLFAAIHLHNNTIEA